MTAFGCKKVHTEKTELFWFSCFDLIITYPGLVYTLVGPL